MGGPLLPAPVATIRFELHRQPSRNPRKLPPSFPIAKPAACKRCTPTFGSAWQKTTRIRFWGQNISVTGTSFILHPTSRFV